MYSRFQYLCNMYATYPKPQLCKLVYYEYGFKARAKLKFMTFQSHMFAYSTHWSSHGLPSSPNEREGLPTEPNFLSVEKMAQYHPLYASDARVFDVRWRHFYPQFSLEQPTHQDPGKSSSVPLMYPEAPSLGLAVQVRILK